MAKVSIMVTLPGILATCCGGERTVTVEAETVAGTIDALLAAYPLLRVHLFREDGSRREHIMFLYNDQSTNWMESTDIPLKPGDSMTVLQLVSGG
jgi:molybdopterin synthase sulfur carrier subunit